VRLILENFYNKYLKIWISLNLKNFLFILFLNLPRSCRNYFLNSLANLRYLFIFESSPLSDLPYQKPWVRKLPDIPRELSRHVDRASYPGGMLRVLPWKHYAGSPLISSELDVWKLGTNIAGILAKLFRFGNYVSEKRKKFGERRILNFFFFRRLRAVNV
jgi:hypothetical protein